MIFSSIMKMYDSMCACEDVRARARARVCVYFGEWVFGGLQLADASFDPNEVHRACPHGKN